MDSANGFSCGQFFGGWLTGLSRVALVLALLGTMALAFSHGADAGGSRPRITSSYSLSAGTIRVQGSHFRENARIRVAIVDVSQGPGAEVTRELTTRANNHGAFTVSSPGWCPRVVEITATDLGRGKSARDTLENSDCPW
jgi:hypothetical protein